MSLWGGLLRLLGWSDEPKNSSGTAKPQPSTRPAPAAPSPSWSGVSPGTVLSGRVDYVGPNFVKLESGDTRAVVFSREVADHYVSSPSEVLREGQVVEFVIIERSERNLGEWVASIAAVREARTREALAKLKEGDAVRGSVAEILDRGVVVDCGSIRAWVPISELAWSWLDHPSDLLRLGQVVELKVLRIEEPEGWLRDSRARRAGAVASIRACLDRPESPETEMAMSCLPFKVWAVARKPRSCDPVVSYVLEELARGVDMVLLRSNTGLPDVTLKAVLTALEQEGLAARGQLTDRGRRLAEAIGCALALNSDPIRGLFASAAHPASQFLQGAATDEDREYPRSWPRPPFNKRAEDTFTHATDEALPELLIERIAGEDKRGLLGLLQRDERLRVFLRRDGSRPWTAVWVPVPEHWVFAGLWSTFDAVGTRPHRPIDLTERCRDFLMVRLRGVPSTRRELTENQRRLLGLNAAENHGDQESAHSHSTSADVDLAQQAHQQGRGQASSDRSDLTVYFEPNTETYWRPREPAKIRFREQRNRSFPDFPNLESLAEDLGGDSIDWHAECWCAVGV